MIAEYVIMPDHVYLILVLNDTRKFANDAGLTGDGMEHGVGPCHGMSPSHGVSPKPGNSPPIGISTSANQCGKPIAGSVSVIINQYKESVKRWCNTNGHDFFQWQPRFYDHIIRDEEAWCNIVNYMLSNPSQWEDDTFYLK